MKKTRMPPAHAANLVENGGNALCGVEVITLQVITLLPQSP